MEDIWEDWEWPSLPDGTEDEAPFGWAVYDADCDICNHQWVVVTPLGTIGKECPRCGFYDEHYDWEGIEI